LKLTLLALRFNTWMFFNSSLGGSVDGSTMLGQEYFDGSLLRLQKRMCEQFKLLGGSYLDMCTKPVNISHEDLCIDKAIYHRFVSAYPQYETCMLAFTAGVICIPYHFNGSNVYEGKQRFSYQRTNDAYRKDYEVDFKVMSAFMQAKMYTDLPEYDEFDSMISQGVLGSYILPSARTSEDDGQLKILLETVLAVDAVDLSVPHKVVVVGSSHPGMSEGGIAYDVLPLMGLIGEVDLYDPYNDNIVEKSDFLEMRYHKGLYPYEQVEGDVLLDDAWVEGKVHKDFDPEHTSYNYVHYSIKKFPFEYYEFGGNIYKQVFRTEGYEERYVSRSLHWEYRNLPIGFCAACIEMRYLLKKDYVPSFFEYWMDSHRTNCITKVRREARVPMKLISYEDFQEVRVIDVSSFNAFTTPWDNLKYPFISLDGVKLRNSIVISQNIRYISPRLFYLSPLVILVKQYACAKHKVMCFACECNCFDVPWNGKCIRCHFGSARMFVSSIKSDMGFVEKENKMKISLNLESCERENLYKKKYGHFNPKNKAEVYRLKHPDS